jgi:hypothetical protein
VILIKGNSKLHFIDYLERKAPDLASKVVDSIDTNLIAMSEPQTLAMARKWVESHLRL